MTDREREDLRGPVRTVDAEEHARFDTSSGEWLPPVFPSTTEFDPDGSFRRRESRSGDGSVTLYRYDSFGRLDSILSRTEDGERIQESMEYAADGSLTVNVHVPPEVAASGFGVDATSFQDYPGTAEKPRKLRFIAPDGETLSETDLDYDDRRPVSVSQQAPLAGLQAGGMPPEVAILAAQIGIGRSLADTRYEYDEVGRCVARIMTMGMLGEMRTTYRYNEHGDRAGETMETISREFTLGRGVPEQTSQRTLRQETRCDYTYDDHGNWTEKTVSSRQTSDAEFVPSVRYSRKITYW